MSFNARFCAAAATWRPTRSNLISARSPQFPIPGSTKPSRIAENVQACFLHLSPADMAELDAVGEAVGDRYGHGMAGTWNKRAELQEKEKAGASAGNASAGAAAGGH